MRGYDLRLTTVLAVCLWAKEARPDQPVVLADQLGVMLQLDNMLPTNNAWGALTNNVDQQFTLLSQAGVRWTRVGIFWEEIEAQRGTYYWDATDYVIQSALTHGISLVWMVGNAAPWDSDTGTWSGTPLDLLTNGNGYFPQFVRALAMRYRGKIHYWEIRNEPNYDFSPTNYAVYLRQASDAVKSVDSTAQVVFGGLGDALTNQIPWFKKVLTSLRAQGGLLPFDIANFHLYGGEADLNGFNGSGAVSNYLAWCETKINTLMANLGLTNTPVWITELDYPAGSAFQPADPVYDNGGFGQSLFAQTLFPLMLFGNPDRKIFWASLLDDYVDGGAFQTTGLVHSDRNFNIGTPHLAYTALQQLLLESTARAGRAMLQTAGNGQWQISFTGVPGGQTRLQSTTNLVDWQTVASGTFATNGVVEWLDSPPAAQIQRFYRTAH